MKTVYGRIGNEIYKFSTSKYSIIAERADGIPHLGRWEKTLDEWGGRFPSDIIIDAVENGRKIFSEKEVNALRKNSLGELKEAIISEMYKNYARFESRAKKLEYENEKLDMFLKKDCSVTAYIDGIILIGPDFFASFAPLE